MQLSYALIVVGILVWFYGQRLCYIFEWPFGNLSGIVGLALFITGGFWFIFKHQSLLRKKTDKKIPRKKDDDGISTLMIAFGSLAFIIGLGLDFLPDEYLIGYSLSRVGMVIFTVGMLARIIKQFPEDEDKDKILH